MSALDELKLYNNWVWYTEQKIPMQKSGRPADSTNPRTWTSVKNAWLAKKRFGGAGIGYMFDESNTIMGIDLDKCIIDGEITQWAENIIRYLDSYTEFSPSGTGLHILVKGKIPAAVKTATGFEMYSKERYFTVTGDSLDVNDRIEWRGHEVKVLYNKFKNKPKSRPLPQTVQPKSSGILGYIQDWCLREMIGAVDGNKHHTRTKVAFVLGGYVAGGYISKANAEALLTHGFDKMHTGNDREQQFKCMMKCFNDGMGQPLFFNSTDFKYEISMNVKTKRGVGKIDDRKWAKENGSWSALYLINGVWWAEQLLEVI